MWDVPHCARSLAGIPSYRMRLSSKAIAAAVLVLGVAAIAVTLTRGSVDVTPTTTSISAIGEALGCDSLRGSEYEVGLFFRNRESVELEKGRDCYRDDRFVGRIHVFRVAAPTAFHPNAMSLLPAAEHQPPCQSEPFAVITGQRWAVVTRAGQAADVLLRVGGEKLSLPGEGSTVPSYPLPCLTDPEPPGR